MAKLPTFETLTAPADEPLGTISDEPTSPPLTLLDWALSYAERGWHVFPLYEMRSGRCSCGTTDCKDAGKHPRTTDGLYAATTERELIEEWWSRWPAANIGLRTGSASGIVAVDIDPKDGGDESWAELEMTFGRIPDTPESHTGSGGSHYLFKSPEVPLGNRAKVKPGIDFRADGGYIVAPPSNHKSGRCYDWDAVLDPFETEFAEVPKWLLDLLSSSNAGDPQSYESPAWDGEIPVAAQKCLDAYPKIRDRFDRDIEGLNDPSNSGVDYSLACKLAYRSLTGAEIEHTVRASREKAGLEEKKKSYYALTVGKALALASESSTAWPAPLWLYKSPVTPKFPVKSMPLWTREFITETASSVGVAVDNVGAAVLGVLAGALAKKVTVEIHETWVEPIALYILGMAPPGDGKTPGLGLAMEPVREFERCERIRLHDEIAVKQQDYAQKKRRLKVLENKLAEDAEKDRKHREGFLSEVDGLVRELAGQAKPDYPRFETNNFTPPALARLMGRNDGRMMVVTDEGNELFAILTGKHVKDGSDATLFKQAWSEAPYVEERIGREGTRLERPLLNVVAMIQPEALRALRGRSALTGLGVMDRFLVTMPESKMAPAETTEVSEIARTKYKAGVQTLLMRSIPESPAVLSLSPEAADKLQAFRKQLNLDTDDGRVLDGLRGVASKLKAYAARVAGILHTANYRGGAENFNSINADTVKDAIAIVNYWKAAAATVYGYLGRNERTARAHRVWRFLLRRASRLTPEKAATFKKQDVWQNTKAARGSIQTADDLNAALKVLVDAFYVRQAKTGAGVYEINPEALRGDPKF